MKLAPWIFILAGAAHGIWVLQHITHPRGVLVLAVSGALIYQGYALLRRPQSARLSSLIVAIVIAGGAAAILAMLALSLGLVRSGNGVPAEIRQTMLVLAAVAVAFTIAIVEIVRTGACHTDRQSTSV